MNLLNKLTIKNLKLNKKRTIVTIIGIILSVSLITAVASIYASGISSLIKFETQQKGNFHVAYYDVPVSEITTFKNNRQIEGFCITQNIGYAKIEASKNKYKPYAFVKAFTKQSLEMLSIKLVEGRLPENDTEILIPTHLKTNGRVTLNVGETITLEVGKRFSEETELKQSDMFNPEGNEQIIGTTTKNYKIVGIIERPAGNVEQYSAPGYTFITYADENSISNTADIYARYTKSGLKNYLKLTANILEINPDMFSRYYKNEYLQKERENLLQEINKAKYEIDINEYLVSLETNPISNSSVGELGIVAGIVCGIIVLTSVFCIKNSFDISITEKIKQYGMLRSIGATKKQIKRNVFYEATILGIIGISLGIVAGFFASYMLVIISNYFLKEALENRIKLEFSFSLGAVVIAIILGIVTIYLSAIRSARKAAKVSPIESIRNSADIKIKSKKIKSSKIIHKLFGIGGDISFKNLKRNKRKYRTTVISIVVSVFVFIALSSFMNLAFKNIEDELKINDYNIVLSIDDLDEDSYNMAVETTKLENVKDSTLSRNTSADIENAKYNSEYVEKAKLKEEREAEQIVFNAVGKQQYKKYVKSLGLKYEDVKDKVILFDDITFGTYDAEENKVINYKMRQFDYKNGDKIKLKINEKEVELEIACIADKAPFGFKNKFENTSIIIVSDELFDKYADSNRLVVYYDSSNPDKLQDSLDEQLQDINYYVNNVAENALIMRKLFTLIGIFLYGFIIVISLIGITNIFNTITTNMELRRQEFAMLKSVGMTKKEFNRMIRLESIFMGVKSLLFGIPIGVALSYLIHKTFASTVQKYDLPELSIIISIVAVFLLITCIMKYSINKINKQNTIETIRNENI